MGILNLKYFALQYRKLKDIRKHCVHMLALGRDPETASRKGENVTIDCALEIWTCILGKIVKQGGPFAGYSSIRYHSYYYGGVETYL